MKKTLISILSLLFLVGCNKQQESGNIYERHTKEDRRIDEYVIKNKVEENDPSNTINTTFDNGNIEITYTYEVNKINNYKHDHIYTVNIKEKEIKNDGERIIMIENPHNHDLTDVVEKETINGVEYYIGEFIIEYDYNTHHKYKLNMYPAYISSSPALRFYVPSNAVNLNVSFKITKHFSNFYNASDNILVYSIGRSLVPGHLIYK